MDRLSSVPEDVDLNGPSFARMYDYTLGGVHNLAVDRELIAQIAALAPDLMQHAHADRACLRRVVTFCVGAGIRQFLYLGSEIPIRGNVVDMVQRAAPEARVMYIDVEPNVLKPSHEILTGNDRTAVIPADPHQLEAVLTHPQVRDLLDFDQPIAVLLGMLHTITEDLTGIVAAFRDAVAPGSYLAISHLTADNRHEEIAAGQQMLQRLGIATRPRSRTEVERLFAGLELVEPGVVWTHEWRPDPPHDQASDLDRPFILNGVGRKP